MGDRVRARTAPDGLVIIDKPAGLTSHDVVARVRRLVGTRKVGHAGTLDPMATGVLILGIERATRLLGHLALTQKSYDGTIRLGISTLTDDAEGQVVARADAATVTAEAIRTGVQELTGQLMQRPTAVSAIKVDGVRSYTRVRSGEDVELPARPVTVTSFVIHDIRQEIVEGAVVVDLDATVECSSGTYIRALARDLGAALGVGGHLTRLRRTRVGSFGLEVAVTLEQLAADPRVLPAVEAVRTQFGTVSVQAELARQILHGSPVLAEQIEGLAQIRPLSAAAEPGPIGLVDPDGVLLSLAQEQNGVLAHLVVFS